MTRIKRFPTSSYYNYILKVISFLEFFHIDRDKICVFPISLKS